MIDFVGMSTDTPVSIPFKRESTCELNTGLFQISASHVSIPFKRESTCEHIDLRLDEFHQVVSIPFKRESTCELDYLMNVSDGFSCFNSLQTGKHV